jgi:hypothetical protein
VESSQAPLELVLPFGGSVANTNASITDSGAGNVDQGIVERDFATDDPESSTTPKRRPPDDNQGGPSRLADRNVQRHHLVSTLDPNEYNAWMQGR